MFTATQFQPTKWESAEQKAKFANHLVKFIQGGYKKSHFPQWFYARLSNCFGHIAHYNQHCFYATWFENPADRASFLRNIAEWPCYGDAEYTYSDVELAIRAWVRNKYPQQQTFC
jgi:hypothetical protein